MKNKIHHKKLWWDRIKKDPEKYKQVCANIGKLSKGRIGFGEKHPSWKGGTYSSKRDGYIYIYIPEHPNAKRNGQGGGGYVLEHRLVMEKEIGRYLLKGEDVHHRNGNKKDNRIENLMLVTHNKHFEEYGCPKCGFKTYLH